MHDLFPAGPTTATRHVAYIYWFNQSPAIVKYKGRKSRPVNDMATEAIAQWACALQWSNIPANVPIHASKLLHSYIGCAIHGSSHLLVGKVHSALQPFYGRRDCSICGSNIRTDAQHAALLNGIASHIHDYDSAHMPSITDQTSCVASALFAYAEHEYDPGFTGKRFLTALIAGFEVGSALGRCMWPDMFLRGFHMTSVIGSIGAAVAVGKLARLGAKQMEHAIGLAAVQMTGLQHAFGSDSKSFHVGRAAQAGLLAVILAKQDLTSRPEALQGWADILGMSDPERERIDLAPWIDRLGGEWETPLIRVKCYPCGIVQHPVIDACIKIHDGLDQERRLEWGLKNLVFQADVNPMATTLSNQGALPDNGTEAKVSLYYGAAMALKYGKVTLPMYEDNVVKMDDNFILSCKVATQHVGEIMWWQARVTAKEINTGKVFCTVTTEQNYGGTELPMSDQQMKAKFEYQVALNLDRDKAERGSDRAWYIVDMVNVADLIRDPTFR